MGGSLHGARGANEVTGCSNERILRRLPLELGICLGKEVVSTVDRSDAIFKLALPFVADTCDLRMRRQIELALEITLCGNEACTLS